MQISSGNLKKTLAVIALFTFLLGAGISAQEVEPVGSGDESFGSYLTKTLPKNLLLGSKNSVTGWNLAILGAGGGAAVVLSQTDADWDIQDSLNDSLGKFGTIGDIGGSALTLAGINAAALIIGGTTHNEKLFETAKALLEANILTSVTTGALKLAVGRERPDGSGTRFTSSFPSGHTSGSFALASTFDTMYGHKVGIPLYAFAGFVGLSRISDNKHFLSDVIFGAALGTVIGRGVARIHKNKEKKRFAVMPYSDGYSSGVRVSLTW